MESFDQLLTNLLFYQQSVSQVIEFAWADIKSWEVDDEGLSFAFQYSRPEKKPRTVKIHTPYVSLLHSKRFLLIVEC